MLRLPTFTHHAPTSLSEAVRVLSDLRARGEEAKILAGGTDLLVNMKHEITTPAHLVSLRQVPELREVQVEKDAIVLGAMCTVAQLAEHPELQRERPALCDAAAHVAGPQLRRMGTLGGNICLDTRCLYINQSYFWRQALGFCLKKDGTVCHVVQGGRRCVAAASNDTVLPLMLYGAKVRLVSAKGEREVPLREFYVADGVHNTVMHPDEVLTQVELPRSPSPPQVAYEKLRMRNSIDYPLLNLAVAIRWGDDGLLSGCELVVSALGARPKLLSFDKLVKGQRLDDALVGSICAKAKASCHPLTNLATDPSWRRSMVAVLVRRALRRLVSSSPETKP